MSGYSVPCQASNSSCSPSQLCLHHYTQVELCTLLNLTCISYGGAVSGGNAMMHIGAKARVVFMNNTAYLLCILLL